MTAGPLASADRAELLFALGVVAVLVAGLLPWLTATEPIPVTNPSDPAAGLSDFGAADTTQQVLGIDRVEWVVLAGLGIVATAIVLTEPWSRVVLGVGGVSAVAALAVGGLYLFEPVWMYSDWLNPEIGAVTSVGPGVYLALVGGSLQAVGCYLGVRGPTTTGANSLDQPTDEARQPPQDQPGQPRRGQSQRSEQQRHSPERKEQRERE